MASTDTGLHQSELYKDLSKLAPSWLTFGVFLGLTHDRLKGFEGEDSAVERCFTSVLITWLNGDEARVEKLVEALRYPGVDHKRLAREIEGDKRNVKLELPYLMERLKAIKPSWFTFGVALGISSDELKKFERERRSPGVERCLHDTLDLWLCIGNPNLDTLVKAVELCGQKKLSKEIRVKYKGCKFSCPSSTFAQPNTSPSDSPHDIHQPTVSSTVTPEASSTTNIQQAPPINKHDSYDETDDLSDMSKPNSANLALIKWKDEHGEVKKFRLKTSILHRWKQVGELVVPRQKLAAWRKRMDEEDCCDEMLGYWLDNPPSRYPATWEGLYGLLEDCDLSEVATKLKHALSNPI